MSRTTQVDVRTPRSQGPPAQPRRSRHGVLTVIMALVALALILSALSLVPALAAARALDAGKRELERARDLLLEGDADRAAPAFGSAGEHFGRAAREAGHPLVELGGLIPFVGGNYDAIGGLAEVGSRTATAGHQLATSLSELPDGLASLATVDFRVPVERMASLAPAVSAARREIAAAHRASLALPDAYLIDPVAEAAEQARVGAGALLSTVRSAEALLTSLPAFAGADGPRRYFIAAQSPAELRGTGGFIGSFAILTANEGRLTLGPFREISVLRNLPPARADAPSEAFRQIYDRFGGAGFWRNLNMTPDVPTAATMIEDLYRRVRGAELDGTIFVTPQALAELLTAVGPVRVPVLGRSLTSGNVVDYLTHEAYEEFGFRASLRKRLLGIAVSEIFERFLRDADPQRAVRALVDAGSQGYLTLHAVDEDVQEAFEVAGVSGELPPARGDLFGVFTSDASGTKVDYFVERDIRYEITLGAEGSASVQASVAFSNRAPADAEPSYALGPYPGTGLGVGEALPFVSIYCAARCEMTGATEDDGPIGFEVHGELGLTSLHRYARVGPQEMRTLALGLRVRRAWLGNDVEGVYRLTLRTQATITPTRATVVIRPPKGMEIVSASPGSEVRGGEARWSGRSGTSTELFVRFRRPLADRVWRALWG